jgi:hypothetical protein
MEPVNDNIMKKSWGDQTDDEYGVSGEHTKEEKDRLEAPPILIKNTYGCDRKTLTEIIEKSFDGIKVLYIYVPETGRRHAYMVLNSSAHSDLLISGTITVAVPNKCDDSAEEIDSDESGENNVERNILWFEEADHLEPHPKQSPNILYIWGLDMDMDPLKIETMIVDMIEQWSPVVYSRLQVDSDGAFNGSMKVEFFCMFDCRKSIYLLNFNTIEGCVIRAAFCNEDHIVVRKAPISKGRIREIKEPRSRTTEKKYPPKILAPKKKTRKARAKPFTDKKGWTTK